MNRGKIIQIIGSTFDVEFVSHHLPAIYNAVRVSGEFENKRIELVGEVQQHLGSSRIRAENIAIQRITAATNASGWSDK